MSEGQVKCEGRSISIKRSAIVEFDVLSQGPAPLVWG
jgi:hypothetical protein